MYYIIWSILFGVPLFVLVLFEFCNNLMGKDLFKANSKDKTTSDALDLVSSLLALNKYLSFGKQPKHVWGCILSSDSIGKS